MDSFTKVIEKEEELQKLAVEGENIISYFNENPGKRQAMVERYYKLRDEIVELNIPSAYKEPMLGSISKYLNKLNPNPPGKGSSNPLMYGVLGALAGVALVYGLDRFMKKLEEEVAKGVVKGIYQE